MYNVIKGVISAGGYKLTDIQHKIKSFYMKGDLTEAEMDELLAMASGGVSTDAERPEILVIIQNLAAEVDALKARVEALERGDVGNTGGNEESTGYPEWRPWDGISKDYQNGSIVSHNGVLWQSVYSGQNVWEPGAVGTDSLWVKYSG